MKLELMTPLEFQYDENDNPCYLGRVVFENNDTIDAISDIDCIVEGKMVDDEFKFKVLDIRCYDNLRSEGKTRVTFTEREKIVIEKQIYELIKF